MPAVVRQTNSHPERPPDTTEPDRRSYRKRVLLPISVETVQPAAGQRAKSKGLRAKSNETSSLSFAPCSSPFALCPLLFALCPFCSKFRTRPNCQILIIPKSCRHSTKRIQTTQSDPSVDHLTELDLSTSFTTNRNGFDRAAHVAKHPRQNAQRVGPECCGHNHCLISSRWDGWKQSASD